MREACTAYAVRPKLSWSFSMLSKVVTLALIVFMLASCGYTFRGSESVLPPDIKTVYIPLVQNNTSQQSIDIFLTEALRDEFARYGAVTVVDSSLEADASLEARILRIQRETQTVTSATDTALQYLTVMTISAELKRANGITLWKNPQLLVAKSFGAESSVVVPSSADFASGGLASADLASLDSLEISRGQETQALEDLSQEVAGRIYESAVLPEF